MKASELVKKLNELIAEHGDLPVGYYDVEWGWMGVDEPSYEKSSFGVPHRYVV